MPETPWMKWYPSDWLGDPCLMMCSPATRGIWMDIICSTVLRKEGCMTGDLDTFARACRCSRDEAQAAIDELQRTGTADVDKQNGSITVACRRIKRDREIREKRAEAGRLGGLSGSKLEANWKQHPKQTVISSSNSNSNISLDGRGERGEPDDPQFERCWELFGRYGVKKKSLEYWRHLSHKDRDMIEAAIPVYLECVEAGRRKSQFEGWINPRNRRFDMDWQAVLNELEKDGGGKMEYSLV